MTTTRTLIPGVLLVAVLGLAACGNSKPPTTSTDRAQGSPPTSASVSPADAPLAFAQCMREHGVEDFPDPKDAGNGQVLVQGPPSDDPDIPDAQEACEPLLNSGGGFDAPDEAAQAKMQERLLAFAQCMREHGVDFPDPSFDEGGNFNVGGPGGAGLSPDDPSFKAAQQACGGLPGFGGGEAPAP